MTAGPALVLLVSDTKIPAVFGLIGSAAILPGPASSYSATGTTVTANSMPGSGVEVEADSASCVGGSMPGICLQGVLNSNGKYVGTPDSTGSFQALYTVTYVSPYITSLFSDPNAWLPTGSDSLDTSFNAFVPAGNIDTATLSGGTITFQTPVPEPGTLALLGTSVLGLSRVLRKKLI